MNSLQTDFFSPGSTQQTCSPDPAPNPTRPKCSIQDVIHLPEFQQLVRQTAETQVRKAIQQRKLIVPGPMRWSPRIDILDDEASERIVVTLELPGVRAGDIVLAARHNAVLIAGTRNPRQTSLPASASKDATVREFFMDQLSRCDRHKASIDIVMNGARLRNELRYGKFERMLPLPHGTKREDITARFQEGLLVLTWPRKAQTSLPLPDGSASPSLNKWKIVPVADDRDVVSIGTPIPVGPAKPVKEEDMELL